ncbi:hypothetical protein Tco_1486258 [Tanacetum coccineum]
MDGRLFSDKNLSEIQLKHEKEVELVAMVVKVVNKCCMMVVKEIENGLLEEVEVSLFGKKFEQDIDDEGEEDEEVKVVVKYENWVI